MKTLQELKLEQKKACKEKQEKLRAATDARALALLMKITASIPEITIEISPDKSFYE